MSHMLPTLRMLAANASVEEIVAHSIKDMHVKGFDYICLHRSPDLTVKVYFFDGDLERLPEVVTPHDHRYDFSTYALRGTMRDATFRAVPEGFPDARPFDRYSYLTPMIYGEHAGFNYADTEWLAPSQIQTVDAGRYPITHKAEDIHTIRIMRSGTVLCLFQGRDVVTEASPTTTWVQAGQPAPSLSGLYTTFTPDGVIKRLASIGLTLGRT